MYLRLLFLFSILLVGFGCGDKDNGCGEGIVSLDDYARDNGLTTTEADGGLLYVIDAAGGEEKPSLQDSVVVNYVGTLTNDQLFDRTTGEPRTFLLGNLIEAWRIGIPLVGRGGRVTLLVPSDLGYGNRAVGTICPNSDLVFEIELIDFFR